MFKKKDEIPQQPQPDMPAPAARVTSVLGSGIAWHGAIRGKGGVRVEGAFEGEITLDGMLVVGETGRVTCEHVHAETVIVAGALRGDITAKKVEIRKSGRVWGDVITESFSTEEAPSCAARFKWKNRSTWAWGRISRPSQKNQSQRKIEPQPDSPVGLDSRLGAEFLFPGGITREHGRGSCPCYTAPAPNGDVSSPHVQRVPNTIPHIYLNANRVDLPGSNRPRRRRTARRHGLGRRN